MTKLTFTRETTVTEEVEVTPENVWEYLRENTDTEHAGLRNLYNLARSDSQQRELEDLGLCVVPKHMVEDRSEPDIGGFVRQYKMLRSVMDDIANLDASVEGVALWSCVQHRARQAMANSDEWSWSSDHSADDIILRQNNLYREALRAIAGVGSPTSSMGSMRKTARIALREADELARGKADA